MGVVVAFDYDTWAATYPEFTNVSQQQATNFFNIATTVHANDGSGPIGDAAQQLALLNMLTAHIAQLFAPPGGGGAAPAIVGRIAAATEGSVSVQAAYSNNVSARMAWFVQTKYGAMYYTATAPYRTARYRPACRTGGVVGFRGLGI